MAKYHSGAFQPTEGAQPGKIRAAHLLVKHAESRRPSSWREASLHPFLDARFPPPPQVWACVANRSFLHAVLGHHHPHERRGQGHNQAPRGVHQERQGQPRRPGRDGVGLQQRAEAGRPGLLRPRRHAEGVRGRRVRATAGRDQRGGRHGERAAYYREAGVEAARIRHQNIYRTGSGGMEVRLEVGTSCGGGQKLWPRPHARNEIPGLDYYVSRLFWREQSFVRQLCPPQE